MAPTFCLMTLAGVLPEITLRAALIHAAVVAFVRFVALGALPGQKHD
jgi:hypothetical protein